MGARRGVARRTHLSELHLPRHDDGEKARLLLRHLPLRFTTPRLRALFPRSASSSEEGTRVSCRRPGAADEFARGRPGRRERACGTRSRLEREVLDTTRPEGARAVRTVRRGRAAARRKPSTRAFPPNVPNGRLEKRLPGRSRILRRTKVFFVAAFFTTTRARTVFARFFRTQAHAGPNSYPTHAFRGSRRDVRDWGDSRHVRRCRRGTLLLRKVTSHSSSRARDA